MQLDPATIEYWDTVPDPRAAVWSDDNWDEGIELCLNQIEPHLPHSGTILDVGAGVGRLAVPIVQHNERVVVHAYEPSITMRLAATHHDRVIWHPTWPDGPFQAAYIVAVLQHLPHHEQRRIIAAAADRLTFGGMLIFQTVLGTANSPGSHHVNAIQVRTWVHAAHLNLVGFTEREVHDEWLWTVAVRA